MPVPSTSTGLAAPSPQDGLLFTAVPALSSGAVQAVLFNPIDRALYVRVKFRRRRFLDWRNFERPFQGFLNAAVYRTLVGASYMFWQDSVRIYISRYLPKSCQADTSPQLNSFLIGFFAGSVNGLALNTLQAVKFRMWNTDDKGVTFLRTARQMYREGGVLIFFRGCVTTMVRDCVFGIVYETTRRARAWKEFFIYTVPTALGYDKAAQQRSRDGTANRTPHGAVANADLSHRQCALCTFFSNLVAAVLASMMSSPFNYVRSVVYGTPPGAIPLGYLTLLKSFYTQVFYIWRNGRSYTELYRVPKLSEVEVHLHSASVSTAQGATEKPASRSLRPGTAARTSQKLSTGAPTSQPAIWRTYWNRMRCAQLWARRWCYHHHHHPVAACTWANSRLNIGWGSIRVGLGMAIAQSLFHFTQDFTRMHKAASRS